MATAWLLHVALVSALQPHAARTPARTNAPRACAATATAVTAKEAAKLFGRLAEKQLFLDERIGACCHSACDDCEWRDPEGGYRFDLLKAAVPKWLPCYLDRDFKDERGRHMPVWASALFQSRADASIERADFDQALTSLEYTAPMGPKGAIKEDHAPSEATLAAFWAFLAEGEPSLTAAVALNRMQSMNTDEDREGAIGEGPDFVDWKSFARALGAAPFERW